MKWQKYSSYGPPSRCDLAPAKPFNAAKLRVNSYLPNGQSASAFAGKRSAPPPEKSRHIVKFRDLDEQ